MDLKSNLDETVEVYRELLESEKAKQCYIIAGRTDSIAKVMDKQEALAERAHALEQSRAALQRDPATGESLRLSEIIEQAEALLATALQERREMLLTVTKELETTNRTNFQLLRYSLDLVGETIGAVFGEPVAPYLYERSGQVAAASAEGHLVNRAI